MSTFPCFHFTLRPLAWAVAVTCIAAPGWVGAQTTAVLPDVTVRAGQEGSLPLAPSVDRERRRLEKLPGGTNLAQPQQEGRLATLRDALDYQPGIVLQDFFGGTDQPRLSIRGSGIQSNPVNRGVVLLQDGLPLNDADGSFVIGTLEPRNAALVSARRGANTLTPSATALGGELDFQSLTGADQKGMVRAEVGSFGRKALQGAFGLVGQQWDGRVSVSSDRFDGYRHHSASRRDALHANVGFQSGGVENRTYLSYTDLEFEIPNVVPKDRVHSDPKGVMGDGNTPQDAMLNIYKRDPRRETQQLRLANRTRWGSDSLRQEVGVYWQDTDDWFKDPLVSTRTDSNTFGAQWRAEGQVGAGLQWHTALAWSRSDMDRTLHAVKGTDGSDLQRFGDYDLKAENLQGQVGAHWQFAPAWSLVGQLGWSQQKRDAASRQAGGQQLDQQWTFATPKLGLNWQVTPSTRLWANVSRSQEAPTFWEIVAGAVPNPGNPATANSSLTKLKLQRATTWELGGQGRWGEGNHATHWQLALYRSQIADELMSVTDPNGQTSTTTNYAGGTRHQGIEAGLNGSFALGQGALDWRGSWTVSDFRFRDGIYAGNRIAGVPRHLINAEVLWRIATPSGTWRVGPNLRWMPRDTPIDHANTAGSTQDSYALLGFKLQWSQGPWKAYLMAENLTDRRYASSFAIRNKALAAAPGYLPGLGRSVSVGLNYQF